MEKMGFLCLKTPEDLSPNLDLHVQVQDLIHLTYFWALKRNIRVRSWVSLGFSCPQQSQLG